MAEIFVMKRRSGVEHDIPVWNMGGFIETDVVISANPVMIDAMEAILSVESI